MFDIVRGGRRPAGAAAHSGGARGYLDSADARPRDNTGWPMGWASDGARDRSLVPTPRSEARARSNVTLTPVVGSNVAAGNLTSDGSNELIDASIDPLVCSLEYLLRLLDGVLDASGDDGLRVEIAEHTNLPSTDRKAFLDGASLVLVHHEDQLGLPDGVGRDQL